MPLDADAPLGKAPINSLPDAMHLLPDSSLLKRAHIFHRVPGCVLFGQGSGIEINSQ
jgi:hypothetical protein